ncbi:hypothetical protein E2C01_102769 [Portunus trituberculatus]|uniref:Uncharacterized protein n=1 Tax=Portunus trituberculatus TaxID=210409 RepID=A0A5B7K925_PORTR|nr:hypothetical protein [Portunus trituberculatus]
MQLQTEEGYTLREARQQARRLGFNTTVTYAQQLRSTHTPSSSLCPPRPSSICCSSSRL